MLATSTLAYWVYTPLPGKILPIGLNLLGLLMVLLGDSWHAIVGLGQLGRAPTEPPPGRRPAVDESVIDRPTTSIVRDGAAG